MNRLYPACRVQFQKGKTAMSQGHVTQWVLLLFLSLSTGASATVVMGHTVEEMSRLAPVIVEGEIVRVQSRWDEAKQRISTYALLRVETQIKGAAKHEVLIKQPGGIVDGIGQKVAGVATFREGEQVLLFLEPAVDEKETFLVWAMAAGKYTLSRGTSGAIEAARDISELTFYSSDQARPSQLRQLSRDNHFQKSSALKGRIQSALKNRNQRAAP